MMYSAYKLNRQGDILDILFSYLEPVCCSMSSSNCWFLTCIQISQEADQVVWYSNLFQNFPHFIVIHTIKSFGIVNKAEIDVFLELSCFCDDSADVGNLISGSSAFFKTSLNICKYTVPVLWKPGLETFKHHFSRVWDECNCAVVWAFFVIAFLWNWNENWPFPVLGPLRVFQICLHIECSMFTELSFRIWNSSTGIPSPPLTLFVVMLLPKAHLTSHSRMSGSRWVITPLWLSGSWRSFLYSSYVYSCHLFLISSTSVRSLPFLSFIEPISMSTSNAEEAEQFFENLQDLLEVTPRKGVFFIIGNWNAKVGSQKNTWSNRQIWPWSTEWSRAKAKRVLPREHTGHSKHPFPNNTREDSTHGHH